jgi:hypothetical protein
VLVCSFVAVGLAISEVVAGMPGLFEHDTSKNRLIVRVYQMQLLTYLYYIFLFTESMRYRSGIGQPDRVLAKIQHLAFFLGVQ